MISSRKCRRDDTALKSRIRRESLGGHRPALTVVVSELCDRSVAPWSFVLTTLLIVCGCAPSHGSGNAAVHDAWRAHRSNLEVTVSGSVARVLGTRRGRSGDHEGFLVHLRGSEGGGLTVLIEDNVDLTGPIPLAPGDDIVVRGVYLYNERGGLIHWTHHDPRGRHETGSITVRGRVYQ